MSNFRRQTWSLYGENSPSDELFIPCRLATSVKIDCCAIPMAKKTSQASGLEIFLKSKKPACQHVGHTQGRDQVPQAT